MTKQFLFSNYLPIPVFLKLETTPEMITLSSYEEISAPPGHEPKPVGLELTLKEEDVKAAAPPVGRVTGLPAGRAMYPYQTNGLKKVLKDLPDSLTAKDPTKIDGKSIVRVADYGRQIVRGETLDASMKGRSFTRLSSAALSRKDFQLRGDWKDMNVWLFEMDTQGTLQVPHNMGSVLLSSGATSARLSMILNRVNVLTVYQPFGKTSFDDCSLYMKVNSFYGFSAQDRSHWRQISWEEMSQNIGKFLPKLRVVDAPKTVLSDKPSSVSVECFDPSTGKAIGDGAMLELQAMSGYVPNTRVPIRNGRAEFRVMGLGLDKGDKVFVKAGLGFNPDLLQIELTVS